MLAVIVLASLLFALVWITSRALINYWIERKYNSEQSQSERYDRYIQDLQTYVSKNKVSSNDTSLISRWMQDNRNVYLFLYKDGYLFFDGSADLEKEPVDEKDGDNSNTDVESERNGNTGNSDNAGQAPIQGSITVNYPTREEILAGAEKNGLLPIEFSDGTLLVSVVDFTEYLYYDVANIASLVGGVLVFVVVLMLYFSRITTKIARLAKDVRVVYESDMNKVIRTDKGNDELAVLTRNVEQMRASLLESLRKEKEALEANAELITAMSHDIRTPLTVLLGYIDIMKETSADEAMSEYLHASEITAMHLKELSDDMFKYFLVSGKGIDADIQNYDAKLLAEQLISEHVLLLIEKSYEVSSEIAINPDTRVMADAPKLMRVIDNVFSNIYKYADKQKSINIRAYEVKGKVFIAFENFVAENAGQTESSGIGLRTAKKLCKAMGASLSYAEKKSKGERVFSLKIELQSEDK